MSPRTSHDSPFATLSADLVGFWRTQAIAAAVRLGVLDSLPATEDELAAGRGLRRGGAARLLRALGELGIVERAGAVWDCTPRGAFLRTDHPLSLADAALEYAGPLQRMWEGLPDALRANSDWSRPAIFDEVAPDEARREGHHRMLRSYARHDYPAIVRALPLRGHERIIDAGGGLGTLATLLLEVHPAAHVVVLDRPEVIEQGQREAIQTSGISWHAGDLFEPWGLTAEVVVLSRVLHDWDDNDARRILMRAREALLVGGRVCAVEMLLREDGFAGALCDLHLLVATGGRERTASDLSLLLRSAGFEVADVRDVAALPSIVVGVAA